MAAPAAPTENLFQPLFRFASEMGPEVEAAVRRMCAVAEEAARAYKAVPRPELHPARVGALQASTVRRPTEPVHNEQALVDIWNRADAILRAQFGDRGRQVDRARQLFVSGMTDIFTPVHWESHQVMCKLPVEIQRLAGFDPRYPPRNADYLPEARFFCGKAGLGNVFEAGFDTAMKPWQ